jgi:hypothetical protein
MRPFVALLGTGCFPNLDDTPWLVAEPRVLAIRGAPPEAEPGDGVSLEALVASPEGEAPRPVEWSLCLAGRTLAERNAVAPACVAGDPAAVEILPGSAAEVPADACARFGPNPPPAEPGEPPLRPADPDPTGGYHLPIRASLPSHGVVAFGFERLRCTLAGAPRDVFKAYQLRYTNNRNPRIERIELVDGSDVLPLEPGFAVGAGREVTLRVTTSSASAEPYVQYDGTSVALVDRIESLVVSWFTNAGRIESEKSGLDEAAGEVVLENRWTAPAEGRSVRFWIVLRDARGGSDWRTVEGMVR